MDFRITSTISQAAHNRGLLMVTQDNEIVYLGKSDEPSRGINLSFASHWYHRALLYTEPPATRPTLESMQPWVDLILEYFPLDGMQKRRTLTGRKKNCYFFTESYLTTAVHDLIQIIHRIEVSGQAGGFPSDLPWLRRYACLAWNGIESLCYLRDILIFSLLKHDLEGATWPHIRQVFQQALSAMREVREPLFRNQYLPSFFLQALTMLRTLVDGGLLPLVLSSEGMSFNIVLAKLFQDRTGETYQANIQTAFASKEIPIEIDEE